LELTETGNVVWKDVPGFFGRYQCSNTGMIRSFVRKGPKDLRNTQARIILGYKNKANGYWDLTLFLPGGVRVRKRLSRVVLETFVGPCPEGMEACHKDGNLDNNHVGNLEWNTHLKNIRDKYEHGTMYYGKRRQLTK
jgi:hypothetical protein